MKFSSIALLAALAASASANPIRIYKLSPSEELPSIEEITQDLSLSSSDEIPEFIKTLPIVSIENIPDDIQDQEEEPVHKPCHGKSKPFGPLGSLLSKFGLSDPFYKEPKENLDSLVSHLKDHFHQIEVGEDKVIPFLEGGIVNIHPVNEIKESELIESSSLTENENEMKWWRYLAKDKWLVKGLDGNWRIPRKDEYPPKNLVLHMNELEGEPSRGDQYPYAERLHHHHEHHENGWIAKTLGGRLHRALHNLKPTESIILAFVIGSGIGSIIHTIFMLLLLTYRYFKLNRLATEERRLRRSNRKSNGHQVRFSDQVQVQQFQRDVEQEELLPAYEDGENTRLVVEEKVERV